MRRPGATDLKLLMTAVLTLPLLGSCDRASGGGAPNEIKERPTPTSEASSAAALAPRDESRAQREAQNASCIPTARQELAELCVFTAGRRSGEGSYEELKAIEQGWSKECSFPRIHEKANRLASQAINALTASLETAEGRLSLYENCNLLASTEDVSVRYRPSVEEREVPRIAVKNEVRRLSDEEREELNRLSVEEKALRGQAADDALAAAEAALRNAETQ